MSPDLTMHGNIEPVDETEIANPDWDYATATNWATLDPADARVEWISLRSWVANLVQRFAFLDHHVIPPCWWRHNSHVEALVALRDYEQASLAATAPATSPVDWMRALRDVTSLLRSWTNELACNSRHRDSPPPTPTSDDGWEEHVEADIRLRLARREPPARASSAQTGTHPEL